MDKEIKKLLNELGLSYIPVTDIYQPNKYTLKVIKQRVYDQCI